MSTYSHLLYLEGKDQATCFDAKFIETSTVLKHNVDELLVGVTKQMFLRKEQDKGKKDRGSRTQTKVKNNLL